MKPSPLLLVVLILAATPGCRPRPQAEAPRPIVRYEEVRRLDDTPERTLQTYIGMIRGESETDLSFKVGGTVDLIGPARGRNWGEGDAFAKDQVLAQLNQVDYLAERDSTKARADLAQSRLTRAEQLQREAAISPQEFDTFKAAQEEARAAFDRANQALADSTLCAPFAGRVLARPVSSGETVMAGRPVLRIADLSTVSVEMGVPDYLVNRVATNQTLPLTVAALAGRSFQGVVSEVGVAAKEGSRLFKVVLKVPNPGGELRSGMTASATFPEEVRPPTNAVLVRISALVASAQASPRAGEHAPLAVFVVGDGGRVEEREVETGDLIRSSVVVTRGLAPAEKVVVVGASTLHDGERVDARPHEPERRN
jgi:RND family efflux transporter MFP subunit